MKKDDIVTIRIEDYTHEGLGIGRADQMAVFVKDTVIGDLIQAKLIKLKKTYAYGRLMDIIEPSPQRVDALCPQARPCGGCQLQMMAYSSQLAWKKEKVKNCLEKIGGFSETEITAVLLPIKGMDHPWHYRNKAQFPIGTDKEGRPMAGFYAGRTHSIIGQADCLLGADANRDILDILLSHMGRTGIKSYDEKTGTGLIRHCLIRCSAETLRGGIGEIMICLVTNGRKIPEKEELIERMRAVPGVVSIVQNINTSRSNVILGTETKLLWGKSFIEDSIGDIRYHISARSFYQVNPVQTRFMYDTVRSFADLSGYETVWDLYCGTGTIALYLAGSAGHVYGVEIIPEAIEDARENAGRNRIANATFFCGKAEEVLPAFYREHGTGADVMIVDPPRKGCDAHLLTAMSAMKPRRIVYVSCDPATLARDLKVLCAAGYAIQKIQPIDMFPQTIHVETVCLLSNTQRPKKESYITLDVEKEDYYRIKDSEKEQGKK